MTPEEWLIQEYQRKETMLKECFKDGVMPDDPAVCAELGALFDSVQRQPFIMLKDDHHCSPLCEEIVALESATAT